MLDLLIITGASKGIGANIAGQCNTNVCKTLITISSSVENKIVSIGGENSISLKLNLIDHKEVYKIIQKTISTLGTINSIGIVLCGAQLGEYGGLFKSDLNEWDRTYQCNVLGNLSVIKACANIIEGGAKTRIVFFAGGGAAFAHPEFSGYALSKVAVVRAVENLSMDFISAGYDASIIALAPGAVATDILDKVIASGAVIRTKTDISEPTKFVWNFLKDRFPSKELNGKFLHVRDDIQSIDFSNTELFKLRRIQ